MVGKENFYHGISKKEQKLTQTVLNFLRNSGIYTPSLKQIEKADAILVLGEDLTNTAPMIALALRQAVRNKSIEEAKTKGVPDGRCSARVWAQDERTAYLATPFNDRMDRYCKKTPSVVFADIANLASVIASSVSDSTGFQNDCKRRIKNWSKSLRWRTKKQSSINNFRNICAMKAIDHSRFKCGHCTAIIRQKSDVSKVLPESNSMGTVHVTGKSLEMLFHWLPMKISYADCS